MALLAGLFFFGLPALAFGFLLFQAFYRRRREFLSAAAAAFFSAAAGVWAILQSRSSTAGIGILFLPPPAFVSAAAAYFLHRGIARRAWWLCALMVPLALGPPALLARAGLQAREKNGQADAEAERQRKELAAAREEIRLLLAQRPGGETAALESYLARNAGNRQKLLAALANPHLSEASLERFSGTEDMGIALEVIRNRNATGPLLEKIHRSAKYPDFFAPELARNPNTPAAVLEEIALVKNYLIAPLLLEHPLLSCKAARNLAGNLGFHPQEQQARYTERAAQKIAALCP